MSTKPCTVLKLFYFSFSGDVVFSPACSNLQVGPISVAVNADLFQDYGGGVFNHPECEGGKLDHAMLVVGYGHDDVSGLDYWIVKNRYKNRIGHLSVKS